MDEPLANLDSPLSAATAEAVIERAVQSVAIGMPLAAGLRIAAEEVDSAPLSTALQKMAADEARKKQEAADREAAMARKQAAAARIDPSYAMLVIYRELKFVDADAQSLSLDEQEIGALKRGCFVGLNLAPGHHNLATDENVTLFDFRR